MKIITVANAAGSAGKTTTVVSLAAHLAERGRRVVVVDLDGQANSTRWFGLEPDELEATIARPAPAPTIALPEKDAAELDAIVGRVLADIVADHALACASLIEFGRGLIKPKVNPHTQRHGARAR